MFPKKFDQDFVNKTLKQKESQTLDFKQQITSKEKIAKTISAMANSEGGIILIGLSDQRKVIGIDPEEEKYMVESANEQFCVPKASIYIEEVKINDGEQGRLEKYVLVVEVSKASGTLIFVRKENGKLRAYQRTGDQTLSI